MTGYNFTTGVRDALARAREEAGRLGHEFVGTEHILLGLLRASDTLVPEILSGLSADLDRLRAEVERGPGPGTGNITGPDLPYTWRAKKVLELALGEARDLHDDHVGTEHLLLGLIREEQGVAAKSLARAGVTIERVRDEARRRAASSDASPATAAASAVGRVFRRSSGYNFSERVRKVLALAREEALRMRHQFVGTEHMLLGLLREGGGVGCAALENLGVDLAEVARVIEDTVKRGPAGQEQASNLPYTARAKRVLEGAMAEAGELHHSYVGTEHLLLALMREERGLAAQVLTEFGVRLDTLRAEVDRLLGPEIGDPARLVDAAPRATNPPAGSRTTEAIASWGAVLGQEEGGRPEGGPETGPREHRIPPAERPLREARLRMLQQRADAAEERRMWARLRNALDLCESLGTVPRLTRRADGTVVVQVTDQLAVVIPRLPGLEPREDAPESGG